MKRFFVILSAGILAMTACQEHEPETGMVMSAPENIRCTGNTENSLAFSWDKVEGAEQYAARLVTTEDGESVELKYETSESVIFSGLESGVSYTCMVRAIAGMDYSPFASSEPVTTGGGLTPDPDVPEDEGLYAEMKIPVAEDEHGAALLSRGQRAAECTPPAAGEAG